jgi:hypothetical protein
LSKCEHLLQLGCEHKSVTTNRQEAPGNMRLIPNRIRLRFLKLPGAKADKGTDPIGVRRHDTPVAVQREDRSDR